MAEIFAKGTTEYRKGTPDPTILRKKVSYKATGETFTPTRKDGTPRVHKDGTPQIRKVTEKVIGYAKKYPRAFLTPCKIRGAFAERLRDRNGSGLTRLT